MLKIFQKRDVLVRLFLGLVVGIIGLMMVVTLVPGPVGSLADNPTAVADVGGQQISLADVQRQFARLERVQPIAGPLRALYARQILDQLIYARILELEATRLGIRVTDAERAERIKLLLPSAFAGSTFVGMERYAQEVEQRFSVSVAEFEDLVRQSLLEEKFRRLVTDGLAASPDDIEQEFRLRNEKVRLDYVVLKPEELQAQVPAPDAAISAYFQKNQARYQVPERRSARYLLLDLAELRQRISVSDDELRAAYHQQIERYRVQNRARVSHILFKTLGKTDAEIEETRKKAADVLRQARRPGAAFDPLARKYSEDTTKDAGGDLGWIVEGQTVPEFERVAFTLPKGSISDLVQTQYGFHILRVADREAARTKGLDEVRGEILAQLASEKAERAASETADKLAAALRQSSRLPIDDLARRFNLPVRDLPLVQAGEPLGELGRVPELSEALFRLREGELAGPIRTERGYLVVALKQTEPAHPGTLLEVRDRVMEDYRREQALDLARTRAEELARRARSEPLAQAARALGLEGKSTEPVARSASIPDVGPARQIAAAFSMPVGATSEPAFLGARWVVYRVAGREEAKPEDLTRQRAEIEAQVTQAKRQLAYETFRSELENRLRREGKLQLNPENVKRLTNPA